MSEQADKEDRTQPASAHRLERARAQGNIALSREVATLVGLGAVTLLLLVSGPQMARAFAARMAALLANASSLEPVAALRASIFAAVLFVAPLAAGALLISGGSTLLQTGFLLKSSALMPDFSRLDPRQGLVRLFGTGGLLEAAKSIVKLGMLGFTVWSTVSGALPLLGGAVFWEAGTLADEITSHVIHLMLVLLGLQALIAGADVFWVRHRHAKSLRMSRQDLKQESQENDGNPHVKGKLRQLRMARSKRRMLAAVPTATVIVTNPTHYAIALLYDRGKQSAPRVIAKGLDEVAARIRELAQDHHIPLVANPPLARALYSVELDAEIPMEHFKAVAEIIAYVWRLRTRATALPAPL